ncbi:MAG: thiamine pyrophosphate-binding protein, partial [Acidimicrobiia bacterium]|nr:thiamine pyrophosphate-binding protein [Acidimicrobiia bacterium]
MTTVGHQVGLAVASFGARYAFGVVGSGNFHMTNGLIDGGSVFVPARHECGAATMADAYARTSGELGVVTLHQGCGLTNALTGITEAAKSHTPMLILAADTSSGAERSNFNIDQDAIAASVGAVPERVFSGSTHLDDLIRARNIAMGTGATVVVNVPIDIQTEEVPRQPDPTPFAPGPPLSPDDDSVEGFGRLLENAERPVFVAGRGARSEPARDSLLALSEQAGALLATSAAAKGLLVGSPWNLDISGGFATPLAAELIMGADLIVGWGCSLNMWTMRHGRLISQGTKVVQVDTDADALGAHRPIDLGVLGDVSETARAVSGTVSHGETRYRTDEVAQRIAEEGRWRDVPYHDRGDGERIDPRTLTIGLDDILPADRVMGLDSGNFMGYPSMFLDVPDERGFCFTQGFQSIGLGLATTIGAALAQPHRLPVAAVGDGGILMGASELDTVVRLGLPMVV